MSSIPGFLSPRVDLTVRSVPPDKLEALTDAICDILCDEVGDRVEFSTSTIYERKNATKMDDSRVQCSRKTKHFMHAWADGQRICPGFGLDG